METGLRIETSVVQLSAGFNGGCEFMFVVSFFSSYSLLVLSRKNKLKKLKKIKYLGRYLFNNFAIEICTKNYVPDTHNICYSGRKSRELH